MTIGSFQYTALFFDFDGVLCNSLHAKARAFARLYGAAGDKKYDYAYEYHLNHGGMVREKKILSLNTHLENNPSKTYLDSQLDQVALLMCEELAAVELMDQYVYKTLEHLHHCLPLWVCSAAPMEEVQFLCEKLKISRFFQDIFGGGNKAEKIKLQLSKRDFSPDSVLLIGDTEQDFRSALEAKVDFLLKFNHDVVTEFSLNYKGKKFQDFSQLLKMLKV